MKGGIPVAQTLVTEDQIGTSLRNVTGETTMPRNERKPSLTDEALARLVADGNTAAFDEIYRRRRRFVYNVALRMTGNAADAEDLTQELFVMVWRRVGSFRAEASFTTWLYRLVVNRVKRHVRYRSARPEMQTSYEENSEGWPAVLRPIEPAEQLTDRLASDKALRMLPPGTEPHSSCTTSKV